ncbi:type II CAAX prenyl endopeptidase Rce1 family protein [Colwellia psychrerythraea]|uniref:CAAX prenyl protease 2/Lysostaphin resistance protein A-like domain-containing protein n=1 Tax=Colwellia psychrerythraea TaxID=28229 RepID=A0A099L3S7_COLPS|nr:CPBP family glutamic-type intramembrane protease [Colwellia psychrerythraea]KGJ97516.1 hypothetical protein GAB14E_1105 [Colwellia psychrerythraea]
MVDLLIPVSAYITIIAVLCFALSHLKLIKIKLNWSLASIALFIGYWFAPSINADLLPLDRLFSSLAWPWADKLSMILFSLFVLLLLSLLKKNFMLADAGFTFKQAPHSVIPAIKMLLLLLACRFVFSSLFGGDDGSTDPEELFFLAIMLGLDKELLYRGVLLYVMSQAISSANYLIYGAKINIAGVLLVLLFALVNGLIWQNSYWNIFYISIIFSSVYGLALLWLREKTDSLLLPIIAHNSTVFLGQLL